ncbi:protein of unknown function [Acetitomaculum ruminis DSM 5522]|uniref:DUF3786 domain-containing protein n=1 Tax=Acetitomaculum ruminis DSM 5522 TaxID=1120918 RepID=A0A1I0ZS21_9FIRM|nr:DUF3786 domain-containing protein [Acetitomaculum ruminis]SFB28152.1 protein of unknown function [Acetitomaculum ruminis DSM 5522]
MSINYHAFQNRGVAFSEHEEDAIIWYQKFSGFNPQKISNILHLQIIDGNPHIRYFNNEYRLNCQNGKIEKLIDDKWDDERVCFNEAMAIYHLFTYTKEMPVVSGEYMLASSLQGEVVANPYVKDPLIWPFEERFKNRVDRLRSLCKKACGIEINEGDCGFEFEAFPMVHIRLVFWDEDEEDDMPASLKIWVDKCILDFMHYETIGCITSDLLEMLEKADDV